MARRQWASRTNGGLMQPVRRAPPWQCFSLLLALAPFCLQMETKERARPFTIQPSPSLNPLRTTHMKTTIPPLLTILTLGVASLVVPAFQAKAADKPLIGLSLDTLKEERWQGDRDMFVKKVNELGGDVLVQSANSDDVRQIKDCEALIGRGVKVLVIVPHNAEVMAKAVNMAHQANIPVISYDRLIKNAPVDIYLTFDNVHVGEVQGTYIKEHMPASGKVRLVRICGSKTDNNAALFKQGQDNIIQPLIKEGKIEMVRDDWADDWKPENAKRIMNAAITQAGHDIDAVLASNDGTAGGAIQALSEEGLAGKLVVTGQDAELAACQRIVNGTQSMTVYKPLKKLADRAGEVAIQLAQGKKPEATSTINNGSGEVPSILLEVVTVTKDNLEGTVVKDGFHTEKQVYGNKK